MRAEQGRREIEREDGGRVIDPCTRWIVRLDQECIDIIDDL